jgi:diguanylate cyclase (GGDEF)-like protein/PAS domain S-box-containing protein
MATWHCLLAILLGIVVLDSRAAFVPPKELTVVSDINYPPYLFLSEDAQTQGILPERWALWSKRTGVPVRVIGMDWTEAQRSVQDGRNDVLEAVSYTEARTGLYEFSNPYAPIDARVFFHQSISGIRDVASMRGFAMGAKAGSACRNWLADRGVRTINDFPSSESLVTAAAVGEVKLFCMDSQAANYFLFKQGIADEFRATEPLYSTQFHWAVRKGNAELRDFIEAGFSKIKPAELDEINARWQGSPLRFALSRGVLTYIGLVAAFVMALATAMFAWNRSLKRRVVARTSELNSALESWKMAKENVEDLYNNAPCGYHSLDMNGVFLEINETELRWLGYTREEVIGKYKFLDFMTPQSQIEFRGNYSKFREIGELFDLEYDLVRKDGTVFSVLLAAIMVRDQEGRNLKSRATLYEITDRKKAEKRIQELAYFDQLTGLPNRTLLLDRLGQTMVNCSRSGIHGALLFIDLDNFKTLNDTLGHEVGDALLRQAALRLRQCVREGDTVARFGGDEFAVILAGLGIDKLVATNGVEAVAKKILAILNQPYQLDNVTYRSTASIGVTLLGTDLCTVDDLMKQADLAMYKSKATGRDAWHFFDPVLESALKERSALEGDLRQGLEQNQFLLHYQAQVVGAGSITGAEALVRWVHPQRGIVSPADFIPLAEETGLILPLGHWVIEGACTQLALWAKRPALAHLTVAVNVSANQFRHKDFVEDVLAILKTTGADPQRLKIELTESLLLNNLDVIIEKMFALKAKGIGFSLDDFGTGYSSLHYLKRLPLDQLKIDQSFVRDMLSNPNDAVIAKTIVALAQSLGLHVIAEGVETQAQRDFLANSGCLAYQGYFFSRPLPVEGFEQLVLRVA